MPRAVKLIPDSEISKLYPLIVIAPALCSDTVEDSAKMVHLRELYGELNTVYANVCIFVFQASRSALHKDSVNGQYEKVKKYLSSGCAVDVKDQVIDYLFEKLICI